MSDYEAPLLPRPENWRPPLEQSQRDQSAQDTGANTFLVNGVPMMRKSDLARLESQASTQQRSQILPIQPSRRPNVVKHTVTQEVELPDGMNPTIGGILGAMLASPDLAQKVGTGIASGLAGVQQGQQAQQQRHDDIPYIPAETVSSTPATHDKTREHEAFEPARVAPVVQEASRSAVSIGSTRRIIGSVVAASLLASSAWFPAKFVLTKFGHGNIQSQNVLSMDWSESFTKAGKVVQNPALLLVADPGNK